MRAIPICLLVVFLSGAVPLWAGDSWENASKEAVLKADWRSVAEITREWKEREPDSAVAHWLSGYAGLATGDYRLVTDGFGRLNKPESFSQLQEWAASLAADNPRNAVPLMLQGDALARAGKYADAITFLNNEAVSLDPHSALIYNARGGNLKRCGNGSVSVSSWVI